MPDMDALLAQKYRILQQQADANTVQANSGMLTAQGSFNLNNANAGQVPALARSAIGLQGAQGMNYRAEAGLANAKTTTVNQSNQMGPEWLAKQLGFMKPGAVGTDAAAPAGGMPTTLPGTVAPKPTTLGNGLSTVTVNGRQSSVPAYSDSTAGTGFGLTRVDPLAAIRLGM